MLGLVTAGAAYASAFLPGEIPAWASPLLAAIAVLVMTAIAVVAVVRTGSAGIAGKRQGLPWETFETVQTIWTTCTAMTGMGGSRKGWWCKAGSPQAAKAMNLQWFTNL